MPKVKPAEEMSYEQAFQELEATVHRLEAGELPLEEALALFERGQALATRCNDLLDQAELKLRKLMPDERGGYTEADLDLEEESR
ncbi:MAG TPA: exodeoxyribonuclease VII small subunit [Anaerolineales bacterium]|nr:exodeoxyribonuclease VII small subunit [Anaerolineales bacterium]